jgi:hypothetical protein
VKLRGGNVGWWHCARRDMPPEENVGQVSGPHGVDAENVPGCSDSRWS